MVNSPLIRPYLLCSMVIFQGESCSKQRIPGFYKHLFLDLLVRWLEKVPKIVLPNGGEQW